MTSRYQGAARWRRRFAIAAALLAIATAAGCGTQGLMFRQDHRIKIVSPGDNSAVRLPFTIRFAVADVPRQVASYAVFIDTAPPRSGDAIPKDADRGGIYLTRATRLTVSTIVQATSGPSSERDNHQVIVVFFDASGHRVGESAASVNITVKT